MRAKNPVGFCDKRYLLGKPPSGFLRGILPLLNHIGGGSVGERGGERGWRDGGGKREGEGKSD